MPKLLTLIALCAPLSVVGCSDDDGANVPRNGPPGQGGSAGGDQGGAAGAGAGRAGSGGGSSGSSAVDAGGSAGCSNAPDAGLADGGLSDAGLLDAGVADASGDGGISGLVSFARDIHPIFEVKCAPCHVTEYQAGQNVGGELGQAYIDAVGLGQVLLMRIDGGGMPPSSAEPPNTCDGDPGTPGCLTVEQVALVATWIAQCNPR